jgi:hypothetical protein
MGKKVKITLSILTMLIISIVLICCKSTKQIPVQTVEKVVYKDSLIYINDTIKIDVPYEVTKEIIPSIDTSYLKTGLAESIAYVDTANKKLHHTLTQKGQLTTTYDTIVNVKYIDRLVVKDVPVEVEVIKYKRDTLYWLLLGWMLLCLIIVGIKYLF